MSISGTVHWKQTEMVKLGSPLVFTTTFLVMLRIFISQLAFLVQPLLMSPFTSDTTILLTAIPALEDMKDAIGNVDTIFMLLQMITAFLKVILGLEWEYTETPSLFNETEIFFEVGRHAYARGNEFGNGDFTFVVNRGHYGYQRDMADNAVVAQTMKVVTPKTFAKSQVLPVTVGTAVVLSILPNSDET
jgi:hypothetical protein